MSNHSRKSGRNKRPPLHAPCSIPTLHPTSEDIYRAFWGWPGNLIDWDCGCVTLRVFS